MSSENLNESQKEQLAALLREYKDQFSRSSHDLGSSGLAEHTDRSKAVVLMWSLLAVLVSDFW